VPSNLNKLGPSNPKPRNSGARLPKKLNLRTYKFHSLSDYHYTIQRFGTIDSYSTQPVSLLDTAVELLNIKYLLERMRTQDFKGRHLRTNGRSMPCQLSQIEQRQCQIHMICDNLNVSGSQIEPESIVIDPGAHYNMGTSQNFPVHIPTFLQWNKGDPAVQMRRLITFQWFSLTPVLQNFFPNLRSHLLWNSLSAPYLISLILSTMPLSSY